MKGNVLRITGLAIILVCGLLSISAPVYADQAAPDSTPTVINKYIYRNVLETNDYFAIIYENTPYASIPDENYSDAFIWRFIDTDGTTELAQSLGYDLTGLNGINQGYGYNVIGFYFDSTTAPVWNSSCYLRLSGNPAVFDTPPSYTYSIDASDYSSLTDTDEVRSEIAQRVLVLAADLDSKWGLTSATSLLYEMETARVLSIYGEAFFRGALYGLQGLAPDAFRLVIGTVLEGDRTWTDAYVGQLVSQHDGTYIAPALAAGQTLLDVDYNLFGMMGTLAVCALLLLANWYIIGGNAWKGMAESASVLVICTRMGLFGLGELGLLVSLCWLYVSAKIWKII